MKHSLRKACRRQLTSTFGLTDYRPGQKAAVHALLSGRDVMCILPTGAGKSLCWQLPAVVHKGLTVVVSPLIALMRDQVQHLAAYGVAAVSLDNMMTPEERASAFAMIRQGKVRIVFVSPERLQQPGFRRLCQEMKPWLVVVDEAHCVVQWGESFRPAYGEINEFLCLLSERPVLCALTATADKGMQRSISDSLGLRRAKCILLPIIRENLVFDVRTTLNRTGDILRMIQHEPCKTVIFCRSRARTEYLAERLVSSCVNAESYHAGMDRTERIAVQQRFLEGITQVLCATTAFGLGVDIPDIRRVIHDHLPDSLIDYVQQSGRAGRDGERAECILFIEPNDLVSKTSIGKKARERMRWKPIRRWRYLRRTYRGLHRLLRVVMASNCIPAGIAKAFGKSVQPCGRCSACRKGRYVERAPSVGHMRERDIRAWILLWQREMLADKLSRRPRDLVSDADIRIAAKTFVFPESAAVRPELERLLAHFRREGMHHSDRNGISC